MEFASEFLVPPRCIQSPIPCRRRSSARRLAQARGVTVPDFASAAVVIRNAACLSAFSTTIRGRSATVRWLRGLRRQDAGRSPRSARAFLRARARRHGIGKDAQQSLKLAGAASRQHQQHRRIGEARPRLLGAWTQVSDLFDQRMADIGAGQPSCSVPRVRTAAAPGSGRCRLA